MKRIFLILCSLALIFPFIPSEQVQAAALTKEKRVIVTFKEKTDKRIIQKAKGKLRREFTQTPSAAVTVPVSEINSLKKNPAVKSVEDDVLVKISGQVQDYGIASTRAPVAWSSGYTGKGVKIAIIDTGISHHEDLTITGGVSIVSYTKSFADDNGHGTQAAGIIGARNNNAGMVGIAPEASLYAVKALDASGSGYLSDIISGIEWAISNHMDIISLSLGTETDSLALHNAVDKAYRNGILVVAAAGNDGLSNGTGDTVDYPARYSSVIAVAATDSNNKRASFSSTGATIEVAAPGVRVYSTYLNNQYARMSGTSMAAPFAAGNLALLKQANPALSAAQLRGKLQQSASDLGVSGKDTWYGYGLIQAPSSSGSSAPIMQSSTTVRTDKSTYLSGQTITVTIAAAAPNGTKLSNANVTLSITAPSGSIMKTTGKTDSSGALVLRLTTQKMTLKGTYKISAASTIANYKSSTGTASFTLK